MELSVEKNRELLPYYKVLSERVYWENGKPFWKVRVGQRCRVGTMCGKLDTKGYRRIGCTTSEGKKILSAHKLSFYMEEGRLPVLDIDHIDLDKDNNSPDNLREATNGQNMYNSNKQSKYRNSKCSSIYKGVSWHSRDHKWQANIRVDKKLLYLGSFKDEKEAARAYDRAAVKLGQEFSRLNFPD